MDKNKEAVNTNSPAAADTQKVELPLDQDYEAKIASLEQEKARLIEQEANWKMAALKAKNKAKEENFDDEEDEEQRIRRITSETIADSRIVEIAREQDALLKKALKENKELKLAQMNKTGVPTSVGSHTEGQRVQDTSVTQEQLEAFKARGWSDKDIERYKKNLRRYR